MIRLIITADVAGADAERDVSVRVLLELEVAPGRRIVLLDDRGWGANAPWSKISVGLVQEMTAATVGPDEPFGNRTTEDMARDHWASLQQVAEGHGVSISASELERLPQELVLKPRLLARLNAAGPLSS